VRVDRLDHLVLTVASIETTVAFYTRVLGLDVVSFGAGRTALTFGTSKINLLEAGHEFEPKALRPTPGSADICLIVDDDIADVIAQLATAGVPVEAGPVERTGARAHRQLLPARSRSQPHRAQQLPALITPGPGPGACR
jgi:catechol 2,3-dioxygenase-like lactoylglutathione lyase family enzyme